MFNACNVINLNIFKYLKRKTSRNTSHHPKQFPDCREAKQQCMLKRNNNEVNRPHHGRHIFSSTLTNPLHRILAQHSSTWTDRPLTSIRKTNRIKNRCDNDISIIKIGKIELNMLHVSYPRNNRITAHYY